MTLQNEAPTKEERCENCLTFADVWRAGSKRARIAWVAYIALAATAFIGFFALGAGLLARYFPVLTEISATHEYLFGICAVIIVAMRVFAIIFERRMRPRYSAPQQ